MSHVTAPGPARDAFRPEEPSAPASDGETESRPALGRYLLIQADQFCACGYNLYGQRVSFDERLEFPVVRCPECGKWHPAGHGSTALRPWLARLAVVGLGLWVGALLGVGMAIAGVLVGLQFGYLSFDTTYANVDMNTGRLIIYRQSEAGTEWVYADTGEVVPDTQTWRLTGVEVPIGSVPAGSVWGRSEPAGWSPRAIVLSVAGLLGIISGAIAAAAAWHLGGVQRLIPAIIVLGLAGVIAWIGIMLSGPYYERVRHLALLSSALVIGSAAAGWLLGLYLGRPVFRAIVMGLVPPRPRMMLAFLWLADGKEPPSAND